MMLMLTWMGSALAADLRACTDVPEHLVEPETTRICVDARADVAQVSSSLGDSAYIEPNKRIIVYVFRCTGDKVSISLEGTPGLTPATTATFTAKLASAASPCKGVEVIDKFPFAPRRPGPVNLLVTVGTGTAAKWGDYVVPQPVGGAVRVGIGVGTVVDSTFAAVNAPGSATSEIVATTEGTYSPEIVIGFAPFLEKGGRIYEAGRVARLAPYVGIGAVAVNPENQTALSLLKSVFFGAEFEFMRHSSLALAGQLRRVSRLAEPFEVGGPPGTGGSVTTVTSYQLGAALIFNVSPEFMEFAKKPLDTGKPR